MTDLIGQTLGSYAIEGMIGSGSNGQVFRARQVRLNRPAALKILSPSLTAGPNFADRFAAVMRKVAGLSHQHIVSLTDFGDDQGRTFFVMDLFEDGSLRSFLQSRIRARDPWTLATVVDLVRQAADGLSYAHQQGVIHGDIKPENLLLQRRGAGADSFFVRVGDFGMLELANGTQFATPAYLSPEQGRGLSLDARSDIYSLGVVLYEVSTGYVPFAVKSHAEAVDKHNRAQPVPPRTVRPEIPVELEEIILRCLAKRPDQRYGSAAELSAALGQALRTISPGQTVVLNRSSQTAPLPAATTQQLPVTGGLAGQQPAVPTQANQPPAQPDATTRIVQDVPKVQVRDAQGRVLQTVNLLTSGLRIGRAADNDVVLEDEEISRHHLRIDWNGTRGMVTDLDSANGTLLGAQRVPSFTMQPWDSTTPMRVGPFTLSLVPPMSLAGQQVAQATRQVPLPQTPPPTTTQQTEPMGVAAIPPGPSTQAVGGNRIGVVLDQEQIVLTPGQSTLVGMTVFNRGSTMDSVTASVEGAPAAWVSVPERAIQVPPNSQAPMTLTIEVPRTPDSLAGSYPVIVRARSALSQAESATARARWTVRSFAASELVLTPRRAAGSTQANYQVIIHNDGNAPATFALSAEDDDQVLQYAFADEQFTLEPGQAAEIAMSVIAPRRLFGGGVMRTFRVRADTEGTRPQTATAQFIHEATMPFWLPLLLLFGIVGLILAFRAFSDPGGGGVALGTSTATAAATATPTITPTTEAGAPVVNEFYIAPPVVQSNQQVTINWNVTGADAVVINVLGNVAAQGSQSYVVQQTTDIELVASGGGKETRRVIQAVVATPVPPTPTPQPSPTAAPPTNTPVPTATTAPTATPVPTNAPTATVAPTATTAAAPTTAAQPDALVQQAAAAQWSTQTGNVQFGRPSANANNGGWAEAQNQPTLEDGSRPQRAIYAVPPAGTNGYIQGRYNIPAIQAGQAFKADVGFAQNISDADVQVLVLLNGEVIYDQPKQRDGRLQAISVDLSAFAGGAGTLELRVADTNNNGATGLYWVNPRVE